MRPSSYEDKRICSYVYIIFVPVGYIALLNFVQSNDLFPR